MPRKPLISTDEFPYHITNRSNNKEFFYVKIDRLWEIFEDILIELINSYKIDVHAFVLMSNHYHLILNTNENNLSAAMTYLHREVARKSNSYACRTNHFFGGRYRWCLIQNDLYYRNAIKYVYRNPIEAGLSSSAQDYKFSTLHGIQSNQSKIKVKQLDFVNDDLIGGLNWINHSFKSPDMNAIKCGLRRKIFKLPTNSSGGMGRLSFE
jgi:putative transposase